MNKGVKTTRTYKEKEKKKHLIQENKGLSLTGADVEKKIF